jgi:thiamine pyrophosphate-dependent acetolactate synthase large subunit-like protein
MATAYAKATGKIGVCLATSGPGGIHLLNGLYDAKLDHIPVLAITGMQETSVLGTGYQQEVALDKLYEYEQAKKFAEAFLRGQPHKATIATTLFKDKIQQLRS